MDRFDSLRLFTRIVELGSFTRAAGELGIPRATATHAIKALETRLGARLLERTTRQVCPTLDGQSYYDRCTRLLAELDDMESSLSNLAEDPAGLVRVDLPSLHATHLLLPRIAEFRERYPRLELVLSHGSGRIPDLLRDGVDCFVRSGTVNDASVLQRPLALAPDVLCAAPAYLKTAGTPRHPDELLDHIAVGCIAHHRDSAAPMVLIVGGERREFRLRAMLSVDQADALVASIEHGCGLAQLPRFLVRRQLRDGSLVAVLDAWAPPPRQISLLCPGSRRTPARVRVFADWVEHVYAEALR